MMRGSLKTDAELLASIKSKLPELEKLLQDVSSHWVYEDRVYRFYHQSLKVYDIQAETKRIVKALLSIAPAGAEMNPWFKEIYEAGAGGTRFEIEHNKEWPKHTRPFLEAFFHAKYFLEMAVKYGKQLDAAPEFLPSGWAALLYFYSIR
jgi:hypothetical protein